MLVSVFLFSVVMAISLGTLIVLLDANAKAQGVQSVMSNLSFALDNMTRNIRTGRNYYCVNSPIINIFPAIVSTSDCDAGRFILFRDGRTGYMVSFRWEDGIIQRSIKPASGTQGPWLDVTSPELYITTFDVKVSGSQQYTGGTSGDAEQPNVSILIQGYIVSDDDTDVDFTLQTNVTQRTIDF